MPDRRTSARIALIAFAIACLPPAFAQTTYRWIDKASGQAVYSDQPPHPGVHYTTQGRATGGEASDAEGGSPVPESPSYAVRRTAAKYPAVLYTASNCLDPCQQARALLNGRGVPFSEKVLASQEAIDQFTQRFGANAGIPSLSVGQQNVTGFEPGAWNALLDLAGYPKTAPYGSKPAGNPAP